MKQFVYFIFLTCSTVFSQAIYEDERYVPETDPLVLEKLNQRQDLKFGLLMHWGAYSQWGIVESWSLCPEDYNWCQREKGANPKNYYEYKKEYEALKNTFNPTAFNPEKWAKAAKNVGMKYMVFTTKYHDGFTMFDSQHTDYKVTNAACAFSTNPRANITKEVFNSFRGEDLWVPDKDGNYSDIVLGYETTDGYLNSNDIYFGAIIGRYGNRIAKGSFMLNDSVYKLTTNNGVNHLHGGTNGFNNVVWEAEQTSDSELELTYLSKDGEEGYPGNLNVKVIYKLTDNDELQIKYEATTDKETPVNLTHHSYFNILGAGKGSINNHFLQINASHFTPIEEGLIPSGELKHVKNTPFDFTKLVQIGKHVNDDVNQIKYRFGYDHNFVLDGTGLRVVAKVEEPMSGRVMEVITDEPGMQFYNGNFLNGKVIGKDNLPYKYREAFCLETQHFPNSPNQINFPSTILKPRDVYHSTCIYKFSIKKIK